MICNSCGVESAAGAMFCSKCGAPLPATPEVPASAPASVACPHCGAPNIAQACFCKGCGATLGLAEAAAPAVPVAPMAIPYPVSVSVSTPRTSALADFLRSKGALFALAGAGVGLAFILAAAFLARPVIIGGYRSLFETIAMSQPVGTQTQSIQSGLSAFQTVLEQSITVPFLAVNLHVPVEAIVVPGASIDLQTPISVWNGLAVVAIALAALVSVLLGKPTSARAAALQGAAVSAPYGIGVLVIAAVASSTWKLDLSSLGVPSTGLGGVGLSFPYFALALYCLVVGSVLGAMIGLWYLSYSSRRPFGDLVRELGGSFTAPIGGTVVALGLALVLSLAASTAIWAHLKSEIPDSASQATGGQQGLKLLDEWAFKLSPSLAFYAYDFGHGVPYGMDLSSLSAIPTVSSSTPKTIRMSILGADMVDSSGKTVPGGPKYEWWVYALVLLPILPLLLGGYLSAAWGRAGSSPVVEGAKVAIPYAVAMLGVAWLTSFSMGAGSVKFVLGGDYIFTALLAVAWGGTFGALGGWIRHQRTPV
jgi:hypothetical protein